VEICLQYKLQIVGLQLEINYNDYYSRISALAPEGHCTSCFRRVICVDVHKGVGGSHVDRWEGG